MVTYLHSVTKSVIRTCPWWKSIPTSKSLKTDLLYFSSVLPCMCMCVFCFDYHLDLWFDLIWFDLVKFYIKMSLSLLLVCAGYQCPILLGIPGFPPGMPYGFVRNFFLFLFFFCVLGPQEHFLAEHFFQLKIPPRPPHLHAPAQSSEHSPQSSCNNK